MKTNKQLFKNITLTALLFAVFSTALMAQDSTSIVDPITETPVILATSPNGGEVNVELGSAIEITFSREMDGKSINGATLQLHATYADTMYEDYNEVLLFDQITDQPIIMKDTENNWQYTTSSIGGTISYSDKVAVFTPDAELEEGALYTFTVTTGVKSSENIALENNYTWSFTTMGTSESMYIDKKMPNMEW
ncbi:Ig-like domain-containing protein [Fodinibius saliphilus]|uniref:Ig-like domain-containing protein n=1 Tax=Fodinibius saliphilus TaxID=1920650 RepID=UPI001108963C|nr:Ig-like domain-containing protein [Fodinibius saliphilus]